MLVHESFHSSSLHFHLKCICDFSVGAILCRVIQGFSVFPTKTCNFLELKVSELKKLYLEYLNKTQLSPIAHCFQCFSIAFTNQANSKFTKHCGNYSLSSPLISIFMSNEESFLLLSSFDYLCLQPGKRKAEVPRVHSPCHVTANNFPPTNARSKEAKSEISRARRRCILIWEKANVIYGVLLLCKIQDKYAYNTKRAQKKRRKNKNKKSSFFRFLLKISQSYFHFLEFVLHKILILRLP